MSTQHHSQWRADAREAARKEALVRIREEMTNDLIRVNTAQWMTWYVETEHGITNDVVEFAHRNGLFTSVEQYDQSIIAGTIEVVVVSKLDLTIAENGILDTVRHAMRTPFPIVGL